MLPVVAVIKAKVGKEKELEAVLQGAVAPTRREAGCIAYDLHRDISNPRVFVFVEQWKSEKDLQAHLVSPHIAATTAGKDVLIESRDVYRLSALSAD